MRRAGAVSVILSKSLVPTLLRGNEKTIGSGWLTFCGKRGSLAADCTFLQRFALGGERLDRRMRWLGYSKHPFSL
jgi:hypothetical protein